MRSDKGDLRGEKYSDDTNTDTIKKVTLREKTIESDRFKIS